MNTKFNKQIINLRHPDVPTLGHYWFKVKSSMPAPYPEEVVRRYSLRHLAEVFGVPKGSLSMDARFGQELTADRASDFNANQFDVIDGDIKDVADKRLLKEMAQGVLVIRTVGDYCEHMVRCSSIKSKEVARVLRLPATE